MLSNLLDVAFILPILAIVTLVYGLFGDYIRSPSLRKIPGPLSFALTRYRLAYSAWKAERCKAVHELHKTYGPVVRVTPTEVSFSSLSATRTIYGAGSGFERTDFYRMFDVYGTPNLFTYGSVRQHRERRKLLSHAYSNQAILSEHITALVEGKVGQFIDLLRTEPEVASETFASLHYFSFDTISEFVYGPEYGGAKALIGNKSDRSLLDDILHPARRHLAWFAVHFPSYTKFITTQTGLLDKIITALGLIPMPRPLTYTGIRRHALKAFHDMKSAGPETWKRYRDTTILGRLLSHQSNTGLSDMEIASECADHLLAGIDTTSDSSMFLIWALSRPENRIYQARLREEIKANFNPSTASLFSSTEKDVPSVRSSLKLPYLQAIILETLRLYAPLPTAEPRCHPSQTTVIDSVIIPRGTTVNVAPYTLHRNPLIYHNPLVFNPERWLLNPPNPTSTSPPTGGYQLQPPSSPLHQHFWSFSSGPRVCIGQHLAMAEMSCLISSIYLKYESRLREGDLVKGEDGEKEGPLAGVKTRWGPGVTSRFEVFGDEEVGVGRAHGGGGRGKEGNPGGAGMGEHVCWIDFEEKS